MTSTGALQTVCTVCPDPYGMPHHPQSHLHHRDRGWSSCVDAGIAPLVAELWASGIRTTFSCERLEGDRAYILFPNARDLSALLELLRRNTPGEFFARLVDTGPGSWEFDVALPLSVLTEPGEEVLASTAVRTVLSMPVSDIVPTTNFIATARGGSAHTFPTVPAGAGESQPHRIHPEVLAAIKAVEASRRALADVIGRHHPHWG